MRCRTCLLALAAAVAVGVASPTWAALLFSDDFNAPGSAANYTQATTNQNAVTYAWDYSTMGIPAPRPSQADTLGVKFESNMTQGAASGVTLHTVQQFSGRYRVLFDAWINANGPFPIGQLVQGGTGSTEFLTAGVGGNGTAVNRVGVTGSGGYVAFDGEGGSGIDYRMYKDATLQDPASLQYAAGSHATARSANDPYYAGFGNINVSDLPVQGVNNGGPAQQNGITKPGAAGFEWHRVELRVDPTGGTGGNAAVSWHINGLRIGTLDAGIGASFATNGSVTIGYADPFTSLSDNATLSFGLIDNLRVVPEPSAIALCLVGGLGMLLRRRAR